MYWNALRKATYDEDASSQIHIFNASRLIEGHPRKERAELIRQMLIEFGIDSILLTEIGWATYCVCSKEEVEECYTLAYSDDQTKSTQSIKFLHDELDLFFDTHHRGIADTPEKWSMTTKNLCDFSSFVFRKLEKKESELVDKIDETYLEEYYCMYHKSSDDIENRTKQKRMLDDIQKLQLSESKSRYQMVSSFRETILLRNLEISWTKDHQGNLDSKKKSLQIRSNKRNKKRNKTKRK